MRLFARGDAAVLESAAPRPQRTRSTTWTPGTTHECPEVDQPERDGPRITEGNDPFNDFPQHLVVARAGAARNNAEAALDDPEHVWVKQCLSAVESKDTHRVGDVTANSRQRRQVGDCLRNSSMETIANLTAERRQSGASVSETERPEKVNDLLCIRGCQLARVRVTPDEAPVNAGNEICPGPLQQKLSDKNFERVVGSTPRKIATVHGEPRANLPSHKPALPRGQGRHLPSGGGHHRLSLRSGSSRRLPAVNVGRSTIWPARE